MKQTPDQSIATNCSAPCGIVPMFLFLSLTFDFIKTAKVEVQFMTLFVCVPGALDGGV